MFRLYQISLFQWSLILKGKKKLRVCFQNNWSPNSLTRDQSRVFSVPIIANSQWSLLEKFKSLKITVLFYYNNKKRKVTSFKVISTVRLIKAFLNDNKVGAMISISQNSKTSPASEGFMTTGLRNSASPYVG